MSRSRRQANTDAQILRNLRREKTRLRKHIEQGKELVWNALMDGRLLLLLPELNWVQNPISETPRITMRAIEESGILSRLLELKPGQLNELNELLDYVQGAMSTDILLARFCSNNPPEESSERPAQESNEGSTEFKQEDNAFNSEQ